MSNSLLQKLNTSLLLADGAMGTMIHAHGISFDKCFDELSLTQPAVVADIHRAYIDAGAQIILTNTFGSNKYRLSTHGMQSKVKEMNTAAVSLARRVVEASFKEVFIAGDVGPLGARLAPFGRVKPEQAFAAFREQIESLISAGVDLIVIETMSDLYEVAEAVKAARDVNKEIPVVASITFTRDDTTLLGDNAKKVAVELTKMGVDVIGINCSSGPSQVLRLLNVMRRAAPEAKFLVKPNAGWPERVGARIMYPATPEYFGDYAMAYIDAGASIVGGCCGTTPNHIAAMRVALDSPRSKTRKDHVTVSYVEKEETTSPAEQPTQLAQKLTAKQFVIGVEMHPPRGFSTHKLLAGAHLLFEAGADVINVVDAPMARMRMSAWAVCHLLQDNAKIETVLHFPTRGRNLLRVQGDLLAAHALSIRNVFVMMGDPTSIGDYPNASDNYDVVPSGLIKLIKQGFNTGVDHAGIDIGKPTSFFVGCAVNLCAPDPDKEIKTLHKKIKAGADFALTQPIFETTMAREFLKRYHDLYGELNLPLMAGVMPLFNNKHANFMHNEVPGIFIPESLRQRMEGAGENGAIEGIKIASELLIELREVVQGVYLMPPFGRYDLAAEIIDLVRVQV